MFEVDSDDASLTPPFWRTKSAGERARVCSVDRKQPDRPISLFSRAKSEGANQALLQSSSGVDSRRSSIESEASCSTSGTLPCGTESAPVGSFRMRPPVRPLGICARNGKMRPTLDLSFARVSRPGVVVEIHSGEPSDQVAADPASPSCTTGPKTLAEFKAQYEFGEILGSGTMSVVRKVSRRRDDEKFAVKCVASDDEELRRFTREEYDLGRSLKHQSIVRFFSFHEIGCRVWIVMELCSSGSVESFVQKYGAFPEHRPPTEAARKVTTAGHLFKQLLMGVNYLHLKRVVHRDLKPANLLLTSPDPKTQIRKSKSDKLVLKITDFNSAKRVGDADKVMLTDRGTQLYSAPELRFGRVWNERVDIWTCGLCFFWMLRAELPFNSQNRQVAEVLATGKLPEVDWGSMSDQMQHFVSQALIVNMHDRPPAMELMLHPVLCEPESTLRLAGKSMGSNSWRRHSHEIKPISASKMTRKPSQPRQVEECDTTSSEEPTSPSSPTGSFIAPGHRCDHVLEVQDGEVVSNATGHCACCDAFLKAWQRACVATCSSAEPARTTSPKTNTVGTLPVVMEHNLPPEISDDSEESDIDSPSPNLRRSWSMYAMPSPESTASGNGSPRPAWLQCLPDEEGLEGPYAWSRSMPASDFREPRAAADVLKRLVARKYERFHLSPRKHVGRNHSEDLSSS